MKDAGIVKVWALSLLELGAERGALDAFRAGTDLVRAAAEEAPGFRALLASPEVTTAAKRETLRRAFEGAVDPRFLDFLCLLVDRGRGLLLPDVLQRFVELHEEASGRALAHVWTAVPLTEELGREVAGALSAVHGKTVILDPKVDPGVLGGLIAQVGDRRIDSSVRRALRELRGLLVRAKIDSKVFDEH